MAPLALPVVVYVAVALAWHAAGRYPISGDEPHYLLVADAIAHGRLRALDSYVAHTPVHEAAGIDLSAPPQLTHLRGGYSVHGIGLSFGIVAPYLAAGPLGARIAMALAAGLIPFLVYGVARGIVASRGLCIALAMTVSLGLPFTAAANQIYPDLPAGIAILYVAGVVASLLRSDPRPLPGSTMLAPVVMAFIPWLHPRLLAPDLLLVAGYAYARRMGRLPVAPALGVVPISFGMLAAYNQVAFGFIGGSFGLDSLSFDPRRVAMILLGLHLDEAHGLFFQQPLFLVGLFGIGPLFRRDPRLGLLLTAVYGSIVVPNAMHVNWYGGFSFAGRFAWAAALLWTIPAARAIAASSLRHRVWLGIFALAVGWQVALATQWSCGSGLLIRSATLPAWSPGGIYGALLGPHAWTRLPSFKDFDTYLVHPANWVAVALCVATAILGCLRPRRVAVPLLACVVGAVVVVEALPPAMGPWRSDAARLAGLVGSVEGPSRVAIASRDPPGFLLFGPYARLPRGNFALRLDYAADAPARWDAAFGEAVTMKGALPPSAADDGRLETTVHVNRARSSAQPFQLRVFYEGRGTLVVRRLSITPLATTVSPANHRAE